MNGNLSLLHDVVVCSSSFCLMLSLLVCYSGGKTANGKCGCHSQVLLPEGGGHAVAVARISVAVQDPISVTEAFLFQPARSPSQALQLCPMFLG